MLQTHTKHYSVGIGQGSAVIHRQVTDLVPWRIWAKISIEVIQGQATVFVCVCIENSAQHACAYSDS